MAEKQIDRNDEIERLQKENEELLAKLGVSETALTAAERLAEASNRASANHLGGTMDSVPSGKKNAKGVETYFFKVNLPPYAGHTITINGFSYYNGQTYELDIDHLRDLQSRVYQCWRHEDNVRGQDENTWRRGGQVNTSRMQYV